MVDKSKLHIVVFPWLAFGHLIPFLELSKALAKKGHHISFISTPRNIERHRPKLPNDLSHSIQFIPLRLPKVSGLAPNADATFDIPQEDVDYLKIALDGLQQSFAKLINELNPKPDWIIQDFVQHWIPPIAKEAGIPTIYLSIFAVSSMTFLGLPTQASQNHTSPEDLTVPPPWIPFPSNLCFRLHEARRVFSDSFVTNRSGITDMERLRFVLQGCDAVAVRGCVELESECLKLYPQICGKPVVPVGLLPPQRGSKSVSDDDEIVQWLDKKESSSVLYIAFGSEAAISSELLTELALGIEEAGVPFVWACRNVLPEGFEERTKEYGIVARGWINQLDVLGHGSIGGVLCHCGWSTVIESLWFGLPLVIITIFVDQGINARVVVGKGFGVEVERDESDGSFKRGDVERAIRFVMVDEEGQGVRGKARQMKEEFSDVEKQNVYVDHFVKFLQIGSAKAEV